MTSLRKVTVSAFAVILALAGCSPSEESVGSGAASIGITGAAVWQQPEGGAPYITMTVTVGSDDELTAAAVDPAVAGGVELTGPSEIPDPNPGQEAVPSQVIQPGEPVETIALEGGEATTFGPEAHGLWLTEPKAIEPGSTVALTLEFADAGQVAVQAPVRAAG